MTTDDQFPAHPGRKRATHSEQTRIDEGVTDFGLRDQKGRAIGYRWRIDAVKMTEWNGTGSCYLIDETLPLEHFEILTSPTRNGNHYGPAFNTERVATIDEARALIAKRTENARKSNTKKFGGK